ncbi:hypothetical protein JN535_04170 [Cellulosimicrobium cellulans]|uniref:hypothetical protein n=1 Tax=Cellulosimicrobium cellulans TaxID=1710 RepID=UPI00196368E5|nr:hypothetical protein [Cellulosimicrobium cellulans]MBN0039370.1 hypothetical protein [Cellulosimicrobium cellulans]
MTWLRLTDTYATHPRVLAVLEHPDADERSVDEVCGFMTRLSTQAAQHFTDYVVSFGTAVTVAGTRARAERLLLLAEFAGYGVLEQDDETGRRRFKLVDDPEFVHMITAEEYAWQKQRKADNAKPEIIAPVRCRDGDVCRYCWNVVNFEIKRGKKRGTYDHRPPGKPGSAETTVVACGECNAKRGNRPLAVADLELPLLDAPDEPYYNAKTRDWLQGYAQILRQHGMVPPPSAPDQKNLVAGRPAPGAPAALRERRATGTTAQAAVDTAPSRVRPAAPAKDPRTAQRRPRPAEPGRNPQKPSLQDPDSPGRVGTGRDGSPLDGSPPAPPPAARPAQPTARPSANPQRRNRRGRRGGRARTPQRGDT